MGCRHRLFLSVASLAFLFVLQNPLSALTWVHNVVDHVGDVGRHSSLALNRDGLARVSYYDGTQARLKFAMQLPEGAFVHETVDADGNVGQYSSLALDGAGLPYISYYDATNRKLKFATNDGGWQIETVDADGNVGQFSSLALDGFHRPHIAYFDRTHWDLKYAVKGDGLWQVETVDPIGGVGLYCSLALTPTGAPRIAYWSSSDGDLRYAQKVGGIWQTEAVDSDANRVGQYASLALDTNDHPHIAYQDVTRNNLKYAHHNGSGWEVSVVDDDTNTGLHTSIELDSQDRPLIAYYFKWGPTDAASGDLRLVNWKDNSWTFYSPNTQDNTGEYAAIGITRDDAVVIAYYDNTNGNLRVTTLHDFTPKSSVRLAEIGTFEPGSIFLDLSLFWIDPRIETDKFSAMSGAGDLDGDGYDDFLIGAPRANSMNGGETGVAYLVYGQATSYGPHFSLNQPVGDQVAVFHGVTPSSSTGFAVAGIGDFNGDGTPDIAISEPNTILPLLGTSSFKPTNNVGKVYILYTQHGVRFNGAIDLTTVGKTTPGVVFRGPVPFDKTDLTGSAIAGAGDVNGDGIDDLLIGSPATAFGGMTNDLFLVYGRSGASAYTGIVELSEIGDTVPGARFQSESDLGYNVSGTGDVNGDGFDDILFDGYLVYGGPDGTAPFGNISVNEIDTTTPGAHFGSTGTAAGDLNHDGLADLFFGRNLLYGQSGPSPLTGLIDITQIGNSIPGVVFPEASNQHRLSPFGGRIGDLNGDGIDDLLYKNAHGASVVYGKDGEDALSGEIPERDIGSVIHGVRYESPIRTRVSGVIGVGDVNGDNLNDFLIRLQILSFLGQPTTHTYLIYGQSEEVQPDYLLRAGVNGGRLNEFTPPESMKRPGVATKVHFGPADKADTLFVFSSFNPDTGLSTATAGSYNAAYFWDGEIGEAFHFETETFEKTVGTLPNAALWADGVARDPEFLLAWDPDGDRNDEIWAFVGNEYFIFDIATLQFGAPHPLSEIGADGLQFNALSKIDTGTRREILVGVVDDQLFLYHPLTLPNGVLHAISDLTDDGSVFAPEFAYAIQDPAASTLTQKEEDLFQLVDLETNTTWKLHPDTRGPAPVGSWGHRWSANWFWGNAWFWGHPEQWRLTRTETPFSHRWPRGQVHLNPTRSDLLVPFKIAHNSAPPALIAIQQR